MLIQKFTFWAYSMVHSAVRAAGLVSPVRRLVGPTAGRLLYKTSRNSSRMAELHGHKMYLASPGRYPPAAMAVGRYEPGTTQLFRGLIRPGEVVVDVGAHVGYYTLIAASCVGPGGKVYAFEAEAENYELLRSNIALNGYDNVVAVGKAVSRTVGKSNLYLTSLDNGRHSTYRHSVPQRGSQTVETTSLDAFLASEGWPSVDLLKIDVEGAELDVLGGMPALLNRSPGVKVILEFNPSLLQNAEIDPASLLHKLTSWGFKVQGVDERKGLFPLESVDISAMVRRLVEKETSINLLATHL